MRLATSICAIGLAPSALIAQNINPAPSDGDKTVSVEAFGLAGQIDLYMFDASAQACTADSSKKVALLPGTSSSVLSGSSVTVLNLAQPLGQGSQLCASVAGKLGDLKTVQPPAAPPGYDWGLVRAYFTMGGLISQERDQFSHTDLFLAFHLDKTYIMWKAVDVKDIGTGNDADIDKGKYQRSWHPGLNSFFETRLTAIPVAVQSCTTSSITTCSNTSKSTNNPSTDTTQAFLNSQKSARLQVGVYVPFMLNRWHVDTRQGGKVSQVPYALYLAPLAKTGFDTTLNGLNQTQQQSATATQVQPVGSSSQFYKFYSYGFRLGHDQLSGEPDSAPTMLSYLDVSFGRFSNLASLLCPKAQYAGNNTCNAVAGSTTAPVLPWQRDWRLNLEGLLEVPATHGFNIGFSSNVSLPGLSESKDPVHLRPQDDLRFLFAYKFDISKIASKLAGQ
jgi:hypothetical protein